MKPRNLVLMVACLLLTVSATANADDAKSDDADAKERVRLEATRKQFVADAFKFADPDKDDRLTLEEENKLVNAFYDAFREAGYDEKKQAAVREAHKGLLKLQWFLAGDLNDDKILTRDELLSLLGAVKEPFETELNRVYTLSDSDVELVMDDFKLRIRKWVRVFGEDDTRKVRGAGRTKADKLEDQSIPFRDRLVQGVLWARLKMTWDNAFSDDQHVAALRKTSAYECEFTTNLTGKTLQRWTRVELRWKDEDTYDEVDLVGFKRDNAATPTYCFGEGGLRSLKDRAKKPPARPYRFDVERATETVAVKAGTFPSERISISLAKWRVELWIPNQYPFVLAKTSWVLPAHSESTELYRVEARTN